MKVSPAQKRVKAGSFGIQFDRRLQGGSGFTVALQAEQGRAEAHRPSNIIGSNLDQFLPDGEGVFELAHSHECESECLVAHRLLRIDFDGLAVRLQCGVGLAHELVYFA